MIIIADSGSSKIDWRLLKTDGTILQAASTGFNPYYQPIDDLKKIIEGSVIPQASESVSRVFFYGTGVSSGKNQSLIRTLFLEFFNESIIEIEWDLLAAARALCGRESGIACIIGTGSNSCLYDGNKIIDQVANLGWILADEGSGTFLGKRLLFDFLRKKMPAELSKEFQARYQFTREEFLEKIYQQEKPGTFLASFSKFVSQHIKDPYCYRLVYNSFLLFFDNNVLPYLGSKHLQVHFVGSVAFYYSDILRQAASNVGVTLKNVLETPIAGLTIYHQKDIA